MKSIELKKAKEKVIFKGEKIEIEFSTLELIQTATNYLPPGGFAGTDMMNRLRILKKVDELELAECSEALELEDNDYSNLKKYVTECKWNVLSNFIEEFINSFK